MTGYRSMLATLAVIGAFTVSLSSAQAAPMEPGSYLFSVNSSRAQVTGSGANLQLVLPDTSDVIKFADHPMRQAGRVSLSTLATSWRSLGFSVDPPNAVITVSRSGKSSQHVAVLRRPFKRGENFVFPIRLSSVSGKPTATQYGRLSSGKFTSAQLFIDSGMTDAASISWFGGLNYPFLSVPVNGESSAKFYVALPRSAFPSIFSSAPAFEFQYSVPGGSWTDISTEAVTGPYSDFPTLYDFAVSTSPLIVTNSTIFRVRAVDVASQTYTNWITSLPRAPYPPALPTQFEATVQSDKSVVFTWTPAPESIPYTYAYRAVIFEGADPVSWICNTGEFIGTCQSAVLPSGTHTFRLSIYLSTPSYDPYLGPLTVTIP